MPGVTPIFRWPFQSLPDPPDGPNLGEDLAMAIEATMQSVQTQAIQNATNITALQASLAASPLPYRARQTLTGVAASVTFSNIPTTVQSLRIGWTGRSDTAANSTAILFRINGDAGANYDYQNMQAVAALAPATGNNIGATSITLGALIAATSGAGIFSSGEVWISGWDQPHTDHLGIDALAQAMRINVTGNVSTWTGGIYRGAGPYTSLTFLPLAGNFIAGSEFVVEGVQYP